MKVHSDKITATPQRSGRQSQADRTPDVTKGQPKNATVSAKRPDAVPPGLVNRIVYLSYAAIGLAFALYNTNLVVHQMIAPRQDPDFAAAALFFCEGMIPIVFLLYITAAIKAELIEKLGIKTIFVTGGVLVVFSLFLWGVLVSSKADTRAILVGFLLPLIVRVTFQDPSDTINEANQRILSYFGGMFLGLGIQHLLETYPALGIPMDNGGFLPFSSVVLVLQLLQIWHGTAQVIAVFRWERQPQPAPALPPAGNR